MRLRIPKKIVDGLRVEALLNGDHHPYRSLSGGRGSGKSRSIAQLIVARSFGLPGGYIYCTRALQQSLRDSSKPAIEWAIGELGVYADFDILETEIRNRRSNVTFRFQGLERQRQSLLGWENVRIVWVGEAQHVSESTAKLLIPTVHRFPGAEIWCDWNPERTTDWAHIRFVQKPEPGDLHIHTTYRDNPFFPAGLERERKAALKGDPEEYAWIWDGQLMPRSGGFRVLPMTLLELCREVTPDDDYTALPVHGGFDPGAGSDPNGFAYRRGPLVLDLDHMEGTEQPVHARLRDDCERHGTDRLYYDAGMVVTLPPRGDWDIVPERFGGEVKGKDEAYVRDMSNRDKFAMRNSQLAFALKHRAEATRERFERGDKTIPEERCLFLPADTPDAVLLELSQPTWAEDTRSRVRITKAAEGEASPNRYDALALAYAADSEWGLAHFRYEPPRVRFGRVS